ncbi:MAG: hypothetical protein V3V75_11320, partial [Thermoguttaceae bacterium]
MQKLFRPVTAIVVGWWRGVWASGVVLQQHFHHPALPRTQASNDETARAERFSAFAPLPATSLAS